MGFGDMVDKAKDAIGGNKEAVKVTSLVLASGLTKAERKAGKPVLFGTAGVQ